MNGNITRLGCVLMVALLVVGCGNNNAKAPVTMQKSAKNKYFDLAVEELKEGKVVDSVRSLEQAIRSNPQDSRAFLLLGRIYMQAGDYENAINSFEIAKNLIPESGEIRMLLAENYDRSGNRQQAIEYIKQSLQIFQDTQDEENFVKALVALRFLTEGHDKG